MKRWKWALCLIFTMLLMIVWTGCGEHVTVDPHPLTKSAPPSAAQNPTATTPAITPLANTDLPSRIYFQSIGFWDTSNGVLDAGTLDCTQGGDCPSYIALTHDGGHTWKAVAKVSSGTMGTLSVEGNTAYVALRTNTQAQRLITSTDQGTTWQLLPADRKYAGSNLYRSVATSPCTQEWDHGPILSFPTTDRGWALCNGQGGAGSMGKAIFATPDGGKTWTPMLQVQFNNTPDTGGIGKLGYPQGISFFADGNGWMWELRGSLYESVDGGKNWKPFSNLTQPESIEATSVWRLSEQEAYVLLRDTTVSKTRLVYTKDDGKSYRDVTSWAF